MMENSNVFFPCWYCAFGDYKPHNKSKFMLARVLVALCMHLPVYIYIYTSY